MDNCIETLVCLFTVLLKVKEREKNNVNTHVFFRWRISKLVIYTNRLYITRYAKVESKMVSLTTLSTIMVAIFIVAFVDSEQAPLNMTCLCSMVLDFVREYQSIEGERDRLLVNEFVVTIRDLSCE